MIFTICSVADQKKKKLYALWYNAKYIELSFSASFNEGYFLQLDWIY